MKRFLPGLANDKGLVICVSFLILVSIVVLRSIAPEAIFQYSFYIIIGVIAFFIFSHIEFDILTLFSKHFYIVSTIFLLFTLMLGQIRRGAVRWIEIGSFTIQPAEIVKPFLLIFFATYLAKKELTFRSFINSVFLAFIPIFLIAVQPSLGVAALTALGFLGILLASGINKKMFLVLVFGIVFLAPALWFFLVPYQKQRILTFVMPEKDPSGTGYNSIQSMISVGSGGIWGRGLGQGVQTQLFFLPERHTDFIFASISEELGFGGAILVLTIELVLLYRIIVVMEESLNFAARAFVFGVFFTFLAQIIIHVGMNVGLLPITGVPLPLVSIGGSSFLGTMILLGMVMGAKKKRIFRVF